MPALLALLHPQPARPFRTGGTDTGPGRPTWDGDGADLAGGSVSDLPDDRPLANADLVRSALHQWDRRRREKLRSPLVAVVLISHAPKVATSRTDASAGNQTQFVSSRLVPSRCDRTCLNPSLSVSLCCGQTEEGVVEPLSAAVVRGSRRHGRGRRTRIAVHPVRQVSGLGAARDWPHGDFQR